MTIGLNKGDILYYNEACNPYQKWQEYNKLIIKDEYKPEKFWANLEYCTWVEQSKQSFLTGIENQAVLNEKFVYNYLERLDKLGLPKGKFTIDDGWAIGSENKDFKLGDWSFLYTLKSRGG